MDPFEIDFKNMKPAGSVWPSLSMRDTGFDVIGPTPPISGLSNTVPPAKQLERFSTQGGGKKKTLLMYGETL